jgi:hypothetical protein
LALGDVHATKPEEARILSGAELAACFAVRIVVTITPGADMT